MYQLVRIFFLFFSLADDSTIQRGSRECKFECTCSTSHIIPPGQSRFLLLQVHY
nr:MAG TPA: hypothetical protein [Caudoviricetes sp.]